MYYYETTPLRFTLMLFMVLAIPTHSNAQEYIDIFKSSYSLSPNNLFDKSDSKTTLQEVNGDLTVPVKVNEKLALLTGVTYERITASFDPDLRKNAVSSTTLKVGANFKHNSHWSGTYMFLPKVASDFDNFSTRDLQIGGAMLLKNKRSDHFNYKFGVYANRERFGTFIVPMFGFYYLSPSERFEAKVLLPLSADLNYKLTNNIRTGINFKGQVRSYNLNDSFSTDPDRYLSRSTNELTTYIQFETKSGINVQAGVGHSFARSYRVYNEKVSLGIPLRYFGDERKQLNTDFSDGWIFKASVFYRLKLGEK